MNRCSLSLLLTAAVTFAGAPGASSQTVLRRCDKPMADAEAMVLQVGACSQSLSAAAAAKTAPPAAHSEATKEVVDAATAEPLAGELLEYASFLAYATGDLNACAPQPFATWDNACRNAVLDLRAARAAVGSPAEFAKACSQTDQPKSDAEAKQWSQCCTLIAGNLGRPDSCSGALSSCASNQQDCRSFLSSLGGDAGNCKLIVPGDPDSCTSAADCQRQRGRCQGTALFVKAFRAKDPKLCGASAHCRVLMGEGKQVAAELSAKLSKLPAGRWYVSREWIKPAAAAAAAPAAPAKFVSTIRGFTCEAPLGSAANRQAASAVLASARTCYSDVELALSQADPAVSRELDAQEEKLIRLGLRLDKLLESAGPAKAPAAKTAR